MPRRLFLPGAVTLAACSSSSSPSAPATDAAIVTDAASTETLDGADDTSLSDHVFGGARPVPYFYAPSGYDPSKPAPLILELHGYSAGGYIEEIGFFQLHNFADANGYFVVAPDGTVDSTNNRFWNATDTCCNFNGSTVDDVKYLTDLVDEVGKYYAIDPTRIYVVGHSNGGAMAYRLACDVPEKFAAIAAFAGPFWSDVSKCQPKVPIGVLSMHGTADTEVPYDGGTMSGITEPSAPQVIADWAKLDGCSATADTSAPPITLDQNQPTGATTITRYPGCTAPATVELWTLNGSGHIPGNLVSDFASRIWTFLQTHHR
ncbi:MAG: alpha/beta hydrolase family esterase [Polyangiales bacterium]